VNCLKLHYATSALFQHWLSKKHAFNICRHGVGSNWLRNTVWQLCRTQVRHLSWTGAGAGLVVHTQLLDLCLVTRHGQCLCSTCMTLSVTLLIGTKRPGAHTGWQYCC
jgi:hypothetical protein